MIKGTGIDILAVDFIKTMIEDHGKIFLEKYFSSFEIQTFLKKKRFAEQFLAGRFATKEAFFKAMSTYKTFKIEFNEIEIVNDSLGHPYLRILKNQNSSENIKNDRVWVSISHHKEYAVAQVIIENYD